MPTNLIDLQNAVFTLDKRLTKRNGFQNLTTLPTSTFPTTLTTFNTNLTAIGNSIQAYNETSKSWVNHGRFQPVQLDVLPLVRSSSNQSAVDVAVAGDLVCSVWEDGDGTSKYQVSDSVTGQLLQGPVSLANTANQPRVFALGNHFVVTFLVTISSTPHLQYIALPLLNLASPTSATDISTTVKSITTGYDGYVANNTLYVAWNGSDGGGAVRVTYIDSNLNQHTTRVIASSVADLMSVVSDGAVVWVSFYTSSGTTRHVTALNPILNTILAVTTLSTTGTVIALTSSILNGSLISFAEISHDYSYESVRSDFIQSVSCTTGGTVGSPVIVCRSVGLASKSFVLNSSVYMLATYGGEFQPTYFLIDQNGNAIARLAYSNGGGYVSTQVLSSAIIGNDTVSVGYLFKDLAVSVSKLQGSVQTSNVYTQTGINLATFDLAGTNLVTAEIGNNLNIAGGFLWAYDGALLNEQGFHLWPEDILATPATSGGHLADSTYFYQVTYEWTDAQGNIIRSAPSVPTEAVVTGGSGSGSVVLDIPTVRISYKPGIRIVIYRWSTAQQVYYQITGIASPLLNDPTVDSISYTDESSDSDILGGSIIYTNGGVLENIAGPACTNLGLFKSRLMLVSSEDKNLLWFSKQVIESTPVEMNDGFTIYTAPTTSSQGSTGPTTAVSALDDKFIAFKKDAIYYITGTGPDNTGANNDFSDATFITSTVGCANQPSIVFTPQGLIFESDKGQWILGRGLDTAYIGAPVEKYNADFVASSVGVPGTNQVRLCLNNNLVLMYDYFYGRWGTFTNINAISSTIYQGLHTYLNDLGQVLQETPGQYLDNTSPVLMSFTTAWMNLMGLQGFQRAYMLYVLGSYISPHTLSITISYDYNDGPEQQVSINPINFSPEYGDLPYFGESTFGGNPTLEQWRVFLNKQKMQAFQVSVQEQFDPSFGTTPGAGLTFSGLNLVVGSKKGYVPLPAANSVG